LHALVALCLQLEGQHQVKYNDIKEYESVGAVGLHIEKTSMVPLARICFLGSV